jgi:hypothetical protein
MDGRDAKGVTTGPDFPFLTLLSFALDFFFSPSH